MYNSVRETDRQTETGRKTDRDRQTDRQRHRQGHTHRGRRERESRFQGGKAGIAGFEWCTTPKE